MNLFKEFLSYRSLCYYDDSSGSSDSSSGGGYVGGGDYGGSPGGGVDAPFGGDFPGVPGSFDFGGPTSGGGSTPFGGDFPGVPGSFDFSGSVPSGGFTPSVPAPQVDRTLGLSSQPWPGFGPGQKAASSEEAMASLLNQGRVAQAQNLPADINLWSQEAKDIAEKAGLSQQEMRSMENIRSGKGTAEDWYNVEKTGNLINTVTGNLTWRGSELFNALNLSNPKDREGNLVSIDSKALALGGKFAPGQHVTGTSPLGAFQGETGSYSRMLAQGGNVPLGYALSDVAMAGYGIQNASLREWADPIGLRTQLNPKGEYGFRSTQEQFGLMSRYPGMTLDQAQLALGFRTGFENTYPQMAREGDVAGKAREQALYEGLRQNLTGQSSNVAKASWYNSLVSPTQTFEANALFRGLAGQYQKQSSAQLGVQAQMILADLSNKAGGLEKVRPSDVRSLREPPGVSDTSWQTAKNELIAYLSPQVQVGYEGKPYVGPFVTGSNYPKSMTRGEEWGLYGPTTPGPVPSGRMPIAEFAGGGVGALVPIGGGAYFENIKGKESNLLDTWEPGQWKPGVSSIGAPFIPSGGSLDTTSKGIAPKGVTQYSRSMSPEAQREALSSMGVTKGFDWSNPFGELGKWWQGEIVPAGKQLRDLFSIPQDRGSEVVGNIRQSGGLEFGYNYYVDTKGGTTLRFDSREAAEAYSTSHRPNLITSISDLTGKLDFSPGANIKASMGMQRSEPWTNVFGRPEFGVASMVAMVPAGKAISVADWLGQFTPKVAETELAGQQMGRAAGRLSSYIFEGVPKGARIVEGVGQPASTVLLRVSPEAARQAPRVTSLFATLDKAGRVVPSWAPSAIETFAQNAWKGGLTFDKAMIAMVGASGVGSYILGSTISNERAIGMEQNRAADFWSKGQTQYRSEYEQGITQSKDKAFSEGRQAAINYYIGEEAKARAEGKTLTVPLDQYLKEWESTNRKEIDTWAVSKLKQEVPLTINGKAYGSGEEFIAGLKRTDFSKVSPIEKFRQTSWEPFTQKLGIVGGFASFIFNPSSIVSKAVTEHGPVGYLTALGTPGLIAGPSLLNEKASFTEKASNVGLSLMNYAFPGAVGVIKGKSVPTMTADMKATLGIPAPSPSLWNTVKPIPGEVLSVYPKAMNYLGNYIGTPAALDTLNLAGKIPVDIQAGQKWFYQSGSKFPAVVESGINVGTPFFRGVYAQGRGVSPGGSAVGDLTRGDVAFKGLGVETRWAGGKWSETPYLNTEFSKGMFKYTGPTLESLSGNIKDWAKAQQYAYAVPPGMGENIPWSESTVGVQKNIESRQLTQTETKPWIISPIRVVEPGTFPVVPFYPSTPGFPQRTALPVSPGLRDIEVVRKEQEPAKYWEQLQRQAITEGQRLALWKSRYGIREGSPNLGKLGIDINIPMKSTIASFDASTRPGTVSTPSLVPSTITTTVTVPDTTIKVPTFTITPPTKVVTTVTKTITLPGILPPFPTVPQTSGAGVWNPRLDREPLGRWAFRGLGVYSPNPLPYGSKKVGSKQAAKTIRYGRGEPRSKIGSVASKLTGGSYMSGSKSRKSGVSL